MLIGERARKIRTSKGIQLNFVADKLGYKSSSSYSEIESGRRRLDANKVPLLAKALGVSVEELFFEDKHRDSRFKKEA